MVLTICGTMLSLHRFWIGEIRRVESNIPPGWFKAQVDQNTKIATDNSRNITIMREQRQADAEEIKDLEQRVRALERSK